MIPFGKAFFCDGNVEWSQKQNAKYHFKKSKKQLFSSILESLFNFMPLGANFSDSCSSFQGLTHRLLQVKPKKTASGSLSYNFLLTFNQSKEVILLALANNFINQTKSSKWSQLQLKFPESSLSSVIFFACRHAIDDMSP